MHPRAWAQSVRRSVGAEVVALDGKALRRAHDKEDSIPYIVSAWVAENGLTLGQVKVDEKSNGTTEPNLTHPALFVMGQA